MLRKTENNEYKIGVVRQNAKLLCDSEQDFDEISQLVGDSSIVLLGESTHGSHEFYFERAEISKYLIKKKI